MRFNALLELFLFIFWILLTNQRLEKVILLLYFKYSQKKFVWITWNISFAHIKRYFILDLMVFLKQILRNNPFIGQCVKDFDYSDWIVIGWLDKVLTFEFIWTKIFLWRAFALFCSNILEISVSIIWLIYKTMRRHGLMDMEDFFLLRKMAGDPALLNLNHLDVKYYLDWLPCNCEYIWLDEIQLC